MLKEKYYAQSKKATLQTNGAKNSQKYRLALSRKSDQKMATLSPEKPTQIYRKSPNLSPQNSGQLSPKHFSSRYSSTIEATKSGKSGDKIIKASQSNLFKLPSITKKSDGQPSMEIKSTGRKQSKKYSFDEEYHDLEADNVKYKKNMLKKTLPQYPISIRTKAGCNGKIIKINQDMDIIHQRLPHGFKLFCVCDGHGTNGHLVVSFLKKKLLENIKSCLAKLEDLAFFEQEMYLTIQKTNVELLESEINTQLSGATVVAVFIHEDKITCFNVGDSRAVLINYEDYKLKTQPITFDHKPQREDEAKRILAAGGRIEQQINEKKEYVGPLRVWMKDIRSPGLAMTRSFGDKAGNRAGTNAEPEITYFPINSTNKYLLVASDGVWEHIENSEIVKYLQKQLKQELIEEAADKLLKKAVELWEQKFNSRDDITFILVKLNSFNEKQNRD